MNIRSFLRLTAFAVFFLLFLVFANTHLIQTDTYSALMMREMQNRDDIELAIIGSSIVRDHFNAALITETTGLQTFDASVPGLSLQGEIAITRELYRTNHPKYIVLVLEPYNFDTAKEDPFAQYKLMPYLSGLQNRLAYYLDAASADGAYLDRLLMFRQFGAQSPADIAKTIGLRYNAEKTYARLLPKLDPTAVYEGHGFLRRNTDETAETLVRETVLREYTGYTYGIYDASKDALLRYKALCESADSRLLIVLSNNLTAHALAEPGFLPFTESIMRFCRENGIPCYNFMYAKDVLLPNLDAYYYDLYHMNGEGADIFSAAFADFFLRYTAGEDVSSLFYADSGEYLASIDRITNTWIEVSENYYHADSNHGANVTPLYRFTLTDTDGNETILSDYGKADRVERTAVPEDMFLTLYAVSQDKTEPVWYVLSEKAPVFDGY